MKTIKIEDNKWGSRRIIDELGIYPQTVYKRFNSKYANKRWGVEKGFLPDGSIRKYVPNDKIDLWKQETRYVGRPIFD